MPTLALTNFNIIVGLLGGWISLFGLVSYLLKENYYLSEALISLLAGVTFSPHAANFIRPLEYAGSQEYVDSITLQFTRLVLGVQLVLAGVQLPSRYLKKEWKVLALLLGPIMTVMWIATSLLIWALVPNLPVLHAFAIGACVTPTDPVLSNVIVKGKFADHNLPKELQKIIIAESGANDGLGYPFLFLALYLIKYLGDGGVAERGGAGLAAGLWFGETWGYTIILSVIYGAAVGWVSKELLHYCEERKFVDRENFLVFAFSLALFIIGTCGMIGSDDILACFIAGNVFTWDDWFRLETLDEYAFSLQPTIDMLLNVAIFMWYGAVCPWRSFVTNDVIPIYRLIPLGILVLLFRRLPFVLALHRKIPQIEDIRQAIFMGFFGPIGCSAVFYLYYTLEFIDSLNPGHGDEPRWDVANMKEVVTIVGWFLVICSVIVHGLSIPLGKFGVYLPRTLSRTITISGSNDDFQSQLRGRITDFLPRSRSQSDIRVNNPTELRSASERPAFGIGGSIIPEREPIGILETQSSPSNLTDRLEPEKSSDGTPSLPKPQAPASLHSSVTPSRTIRFPSEEESQSNRKPQGSGSEAAS